MKNQKNISIVLLGLACLLFVTAIIMILNTNYFSFTNSTNHRNLNEQGEKEPESESIETGDNNIDYSSGIDPNSPVEVPKQGVSDLEINQNPSNSSSVIGNENNTTESKNENDLIESKNEDNVISYFEAEGSLLNMTSDQEDVTLRERVKNTFTTIIDFIFYDKEVKGYTFKELTTSAKLKIIKIALSIDNKIDQYFPNYKDTIKDKYTDFKGKLAIKYLEFTSYLCETVGEDTCNQAKEDFNSMKESFGLTWQLIKELAASGSNKVKEFYESWRDSK